MDPYEQQLLKVFNSHDRDQCGTLDKDGLTQLCQTLQLEDQSQELVKCLMRESKFQRITFADFKEALLNLLGNMQNNKSVIQDENKEPEKTSPDREVSPKLVYGSKKYGRRSRPRIDEVTKIFTEENDISIGKSQNTSVQRSNSQSEVSNSKKRKTNYKLKRCTSLPGHTDLNKNQSAEGHFVASHAIGCEPELICTEEMLREAWKKLGVGEDGYLNQTELILVCDEIGLHKLAEGVIRQLSDKLTLNYDHKISFQELLETLQQDETWCDVFNTSSNNNDAIKISLSSENVFPDSRTFQYITLGPDGNGWVTVESLIEMWEGVGIHSPKELIHELGFNARNINIQELGEVLEKQTKGMNETTRSEFQSPHIVLLKANLILYQSEIRGLKNILEQMHAEREKLKCDVLEANKRATLLAQEVDDNHLKMERNTLNQVKLLEQRHADILKEVTEQYGKDKDQLSLINHSLEERIGNLEQEIHKLKNDLVVAQEYSINVEKENQALGSKVTDLEKDKENLGKQIGALENENQKYGALEIEEYEMLITKLSALQVENSQLKDKNDEMASELENLSTQVSSMRGKVSSTPTYNTLDHFMEENVSIIGEGVNIGAKRRSDYSPTKDCQLFMSDGSPRLGKVRKFHKMKGELLEVPFTSSESGFDTEVDYFDSSLSASTGDNEEINRLLAKVVFLEQILAQHSIPIPDSMFDGPCSVDTNIQNLTDRVHELEKIIFDVKASLKKMIDKDYISKDNMYIIKNKLDTVQIESSMANDSFELMNETVLKPKNVCDASMQTEYAEDLKGKCEELEKSNTELTGKCNEYENCIELLRNEIERCEDYWQTKIDEERQIFEQEHKQTSDTLTDLLIKLKEYDEQYASQDQTDNSRLPPIEEFNLEKQFTDLEQEYEEYKEQTEEEILIKDNEIALLKEKLSELALRQKTNVEVGCQTNDGERILDKMKDFSYHIVENTCLFSEDLVPSEQMEKSEEWNQNNQNKPVETTNSSPFNWNFNNEMKTQSPISNVPSTSSSSTCLDKNSTPCRPKRTRKHDKNMYKKNNSEKDFKKTENIKTAVPGEWKCPNLKGSAEQTMVLPIHSYHNLNSRRNYLEQRVRHLQLCLKQQHIHNEQTLQHYWQQFKAEKTDLHCKLKFLSEKLDQQVRISHDQIHKLERNDLLVKELYVENSYLIANVQRLEQKCHRAMLEQFESNHQKTN